VRHSRANGSPRSALDLPTGTVTFLITDIEGSTRILEQHSLAAASERRLREIGGATTVEMSGLEPPMLRGARLVDTSTFARASSDEEALTIDDAVREALAIARRAEAGLDVLHASSA
jgi:class 3 adenylate cyclase